MERSASALRSITLTPLGGFQHALGPQGYRLGLVIDQGFAISPQAHHAERPNRVQLPS